jgi:hypothetical protein
MLMRFNRVARFIVNANHRAMRMAVKLRIADCAAHGIQLTVPWATRRGLCMFGKERK